MTERRTFGLTEDHIAVAERWRAQQFSAGEAAELAVASGWSPAATIKMLKLHFQVNLSKGKAMVDACLSADDMVATNYLRVQAEFALRLPPETTEEDLERFESATGWARKLRGLIKDDRLDDAYAALDRFDPETMTFHLLELADALRLVEQEINDWPMEMQILGDATQEFDFGWLIWCQAAKYIESGDIFDVAIGHGPFVVDKFTGAMWATGSAPTDRVGNYRRTGNPMPG